MAWAKSDRWRRRVSPPETLPAATILPALGPMPYAAGKATPDSLTLGNIVNPDGSMNTEIRDGGEQHNLIFGPNGKGKGTRILVPNLLTLQNSSVVVVDPKGELAALTLDRRKDLGAVYILNPYGVLTGIPGFEDLQSVGFNPLAGLDPHADTFNTDTRELAYALIKVEGKEPYWTESARALLNMLIMFTAMEAYALKKAPTFARVRELLCQYSAAPSAENNFEGVGIPKLALRVMRYNNPGLRNLAAQFTDWNKEVSGIANSARIQTEAFDDPFIMRDMEKTGLDFAEIKKRPCTVYIILPPERLEDQSRWLRLILTKAIQGVMRVRRPGEPRVFFMLDEFFAIGHLQIIQKVWALVRGYGIRMMPILQSIEQLKMLYPQLWKDFIGMAGTTSFFGPNDLDTAKYIAERAGETTRRIESASTSDSHTITVGNSVNNGERSSSVGESDGESWSYGRNISISQQKTPTLTPHKVMGLAPGMLLTSIDGLSHLVPTYAPAYYERHDLAALVRRRNPYFNG